MVGSSLLSLVQPSPAYDPRVYSIYTAVMSQLPIATYKDDNDFGTFFRKALALIAKVAPFVGAAFGPLGAAIGTAVGGAAKVGTLIVKPKNPKREPSARPPGRGRRIPRPGAWSHKDK